VLFQDCLLRSAPSPTSVKHNSLAGREEGDGTINGYLAKSDRKPIIPNQPPISLCSVSQLPFPSSWSSPSGPYSKLHFHSWMNHPSLIPHTHSSFTNNPPSSASGTSTYHPADFPPQTGFTSSRIPTLILTQHTKSGPSLCLRLRCQFLGFVSAKNQPEHLKTMANR